MIARAVTEQLQEERKDELAAIRAEICSDAKVLTSGITHIRCLRLVPRIWLLGKVPNRLKYDSIIALCGRVCLSCANMFRTGHYQGRRVCISSLGTAIS